MLKIERQQKYLQKRIEEIEMYLIKFCKYLKQEDLHALRIALKKYRALVFLSGKMAKKKKLKQNLLPMKDFFQKAGEIRSIYVHQKLLIKHAIKNKDLLNALQLDLEKKTHDFIEKSATHLNHNLKAHKHILKRLTKPEKGQIFSFFDAYLKTLENCLNSSEDFHECRKQLKRLLYLKEIFTPKALEKLGFNFKYIDELQDAIGTWHDALMLRDFLLETKGVNKRLLSKIEKEVTASSDVLFELKKDFRIKLRKV